MDYHWYPGHMTKAVRQMKEDIKLIDLVIELLDARIPLSSRNPDIDDLGKNKARLVLLNKSDLADETDNNKWIQYFKDKGIIALKINSKNKQGIKEINNAVQIACKEKIERDKKRGIINRPVRAMVVGIPNVGKSTFINAYAGRAAAKTGNKPGVTKGNHWHNSKWELFIVVSGHGVIEQRKIGSDEVLRFEVSGEKIESVHILPGYTHNIINLSDKDDLVTVMWANECFDPDKPDTYSEKV